LKVQSSLNLRCFPKQTTDDNDVGLSFENSHMLGNIIVSNTHLSLKKTRHNPCTKRILNLMFDVPYKIWKSIYIYIYICKSHPTT